MSDQKNAGDMAGQLVRIRALAAQARALLAEEVSNTASFVTKLADYVRDLEEWQASPGTKALMAQLPSLKGKEQAELRNLLEAFSKEHQAVLQLAQQCRNNVADEMSHLHQKGRALRTYLDRLPTRVNVTGQRRV